LSDILFTLEYDLEWDKYFSKLDKSEKEKLGKKILTLKTKDSSRHLKYGLNFFVLESGQYRVCFEQINKKRIIMFAGNHKQYEKWLKQQ